MPLGSFPMPLPIWCPLLRVAGRFVVWLLGARDGLGRDSSSAGVAVTGALPTWPRFRAAILAWMDCAWVEFAAIAVSMKASHRCLDMLCR